MRIISFLLLICNIAHSQDSNISEHAIAADVAGRAGMVREAIKEWKLDYAIGRNAETAYALAALYALSENADSAFFWLEPALEKDSSDHVLTDGDLIFLTFQEKWKTIENQQIAKLERKQGKFKNLPLSRQLWHIQMKDQAYTTQYSMARNKLGPEDPICLALVVLFQKIREENAVEVEKIIRRYGWPKISVVGESAAQSVFYVVQHGAPEARKQNLPLLQAACRAKEAPWLWYATMYDRMLNDQGKKQLYGTQYSFGANGTVIRKPIESPEYVNKRRRELGLDPIDNPDVPQKD